MKERESDSVSASHYDYEYAVTLAHWHLAEQLFYESVVTTQIHIMKSYFTKLDNILFHCPFHCPNDVNYRISIRYEKRNKTIKLLKPSKVLGLLNILCLWIIFFSFLRFSYQQNPSWKTKVIIDYNNLGLIYIFQFKICHSHDNKINWKKKFIICHTTQVLSMSLLYR